MTTISMSTQVDFAPKTSAHSAAGDTAHRDAQLLGRLTGLMFIVTFATAIPPVVTFYVPTLSDPAFVLGGGFDKDVSWGALLELVLILSNVATAIALYPVLKRRFRFHRRRARRASCNGGWTRRRQLGRMASRRHGCIAPPARWKHLAAGRVDVLRAVRRGPRIPLRNRRGHGYESWSRSDASLAAWHRIYLRRAVRDVPRPCRGPAPELFYGSHCLI